MQSGPDCRPVFVPESNFDIYQTEAGFTAVTNKVRRAILDALAQQDLGLPELVKVTGKAKPTLSSVHMKELLAQRLVDELPHPTDNRKKIYRLRARRVGSSDTPGEPLRAPTEGYADVSPLATRLPLVVAFDAIASAPASADEATLQSQARRLGELTSNAETRGEHRATPTRVAALLEQEGLARPLRLDLEHQTLEMEWTHERAGHVTTERVARLVAAFLDGALWPRDGAAPRVGAAALAKPGRFTLRLPTADLTG